MHRARFSGTEDARLVALRARGAVRWEHDYDGFVLAGIDERAAGGDLMRLGLEWHDEQDLIALQDFLLDTAEPARVLARLQPEEVLGDPLDPNLDPDAGLYLVQFVAPARDEHAARHVQQLPQPFPHRALPFAHR